MALLAMVATGGCAAQPLPSQGSLLDDGAGHATVCVEASAEGYTFGAETLRNIGAAQVQITSISAINERNVVLVDSFVIPVPEGSPVGSGSWPPSGPAVKDASLQSYAALVIPPAATAPGTSYNLVIHVGKASVLPAGFDGLRINYTADDRQFFQDTTNALLIKQSC